MKKKSLALVLALAMIVVCVVGGTLAWLIAETDSVTNTFTVGDINITLDETKTDFKMIPGYTIDKDPKVTVVAGSEKCYLFVKLDESANFDDFMTYTIEAGATGWTQGDGTNIPSNVYYRVVENSTTNQTFSVLAGDKVTVKDTVTKTMLNNLTANTYPTLTVTAYASQYMKNNTEYFEAIDAWNNIKPASNP